MLHRRRPCKLQLAMNLGYLIGFLETASFPLQALHAPSNNVSMLTIDLLALETSTKDTTLELLGTERSRRLVPTIRVHLTQYLLQNLAGRRLGDGLAEAHLAVHDLVLGEVLQQERENVLRGEVAVLTCHHEGAGNFGALPWDGDADDGCVQDVVVLEEATFQFGGRDLPAADFDKFLSHVVSVSSDDGNEVGMRSRTFLRSMMYNLPFSLR